MAGRRGRLIDRHNYRSEEASLTPDQIQALTALLLRVEQFYSHPVDIEWAYANGSLHLLQARPVTSFVPLPEAMRTQPGERRRLYMDVALSSGLTSNEALSPMGLDVFRRIFAFMLRFTLGNRPLQLDESEALMLCAGGRIYQNVSNLLWLNSPRQMAAGFEANDVLMSRILENIDAKQYRSEKRPVWARWTMLLRLPGVLWRLRRALVNGLAPMVTPQRWHRRLLRRIEADQRERDQPPDASLPLASFWQQCMDARLRPLFEVSLAAIGPGLMAVAGFKRLAKGVAGVDLPLLQSLDHGFADNVVVGMTLSMSRIGDALSDEEREDIQGLSAQLRDGTARPDLLQLWREFVRLYGCRGPLEMDIASRRYADEPALALAQIAAMPVTDSEHNPAAAVARQIDSRRAAMATVIAKAGPLRRVILSHLQVIIEAYAGLRDTPKQHYLSLLHQLRKRILDEGRRLHGQGRLDAPEHVFDLEFLELLAAAEDPQLDLRSRREPRIESYRTLARQVINFPRVIDSRGRILRAPPTESREGEYRGLGLSAGLVRGRARTLRTACDGTLKQGEVLIAYTTDPGWTPLFVNAVAVVLEVGGALQHGAVVARELGLPCVAGIDGISTAIADGQLLEVDGAAGTVRLLEREGSSDSRV